MGEVVDKYFLVKYIALIHNLESLSDNNKI